MDVYDLQDKRVRVSGFRMGWEPMVFDGTVTDVHKTEDGNQHQLRIRFDRPDDVLRTFLLDPKKAEIVGWGEDETKLERDRIDQTIAVPIHHEIGKKQEHKSITMRALSYETRIMSSYLVHGAQIAVI